ncbi:MAG: alpha-ketoglutarate-dependent dioxygenase AlkB [Nannocystaceae bacterium]
MEGFLAHPLGDGHVLHVGALPPTLRPDAAGFEALWALHPADYHVISMHGRSVATPRWQQAYGADYRYTGQTNRARPLTPEMEPFLTWTRSAIDGRLNGLLFNWYDAERRHYIGKHRDSRIGMIDGAPIVTISLGATRTFRIRPWRGQGALDFEARDGAVFVLPYAANLVFTHEVPHTARCHGRRISITVRGFTDGAPS